ncbi:MAG TPA: hypothetical protein DEP03_16350 [Massilia sp.]|nr:hypothetical protein [Massilia sp.]
MSIALAQQIRSALAEFSSASRLLELVIDEGRAGQVRGSLLVEAFAALDALQEVGARDVIVLSTSAHVALETLLGEPAALELSLADGSRERFAGEISEVALARHARRRRPSR